MQKKADNAGRSYRSVADAAIRSMRRKSAMAVIAHFDMPDSTGRIIAGQHGAITDILAHNNVCTQFVDKNEGTLVKEMGDAVMAVFTFMPNAIACAREAISYLKHSRYGMSTKVAISAGRIEVITGESGTDIYGAAVSLCSRMAGEVGKNCMIIEEKRFAECIGPLADAAIRILPPKTCLFRGFPAGIKTRQVRIL